MNIEYLLEHQKQIMVVSSCRMLWTLHHTLRTIDWIIPSRWKSVNGFAFSNAAAVTSASVFCAMSCTVLLNARNERCSPAALCTQLLFAIFHQLHGIALDAIPNFWILGVNNNFGTTLHAARVTVQQNPTHTHVTQFCGPAIIDTAAFTVILLFFHHSNVANAFNARLLLWSGEEFLPLNSRTTIPVNL